jgi:hypothetical protein
VAIEVQSYLFEEAVNDAEWELAPLRMPPLEVLIRYDQEQARLLPSG